MSGSLIVEIDRTQYPINARHVLLYDEEVNPLHTRAWAFRELITLLS